MATARLDLVSEDREGRGAGGTAFRLLRVVRDVLLVLALTGQLTRSDRPLCPATMGSFSERVVPVAAVAQQVLPGRVGAPRLCIGTVTGGPRRLTPHR
jgi:hypothetical protein